MKITIVVWLLVLFPAGVWAGLDPTPDQMGFYFDPLGETIDLELATFSPFTLYIIYTNPTLESIRGFECDLAMYSDGPTQSIILDTAYPVPQVDIGSKSQSRAMYIVGFTEPIPTTPATVLAQVNLFYLDSSPLLFYQGPAEPASLGSGLPVVMGEDFALLPTGLSVPDGPAATVNGEDSVVHTNQAPWDFIKSLYR